MHCKGMGAGSNPTGGIFLPVVMSHRFSFFWGAFGAFGRKKSIFPIFWVVTLGPPLPPPFRPSPPF